MAIPEVQTRAKLVAFLERYFAKKGSSGGSGTPAGSNTQVQYNNAGSFGGSANLTFDGTTLTATGLSNTGNTTLGDASGDSVTINAATINPANIAAGTDNTVVVYNGSTLVTDEIDSRVWGATLVDASGTPADNQVGIWTDANTMEGSSNLTFDGTDLTVGGDLTVTGGDITLGAATSYIKDSGGDNRIKIDANYLYLLDNGGSSEFYATDGECKAYGNFLVGGDLTVTGNDIKNSAGLTTITMNADGSITSPLQPAVYAFRTSTQDFSPNDDPEVIIFNDESTTNNTAFDVGSDYNTSTGIFTAPADGKYLVQASALLTEVPTNSVVLIYCESTNSAADSINMYSNRISPELLTGSTNPIDYLFVEGTWLVNMDASDTAKIYAWVTAGISTTKIYGASNNQYTRIQIIKVA